MKKHIYHNDHLGSTRAITDEDGTIVASVDYYPFGDVLSQTGDSHLKYNGKELDEGYGFDLYYYGARYYNSGLGRFISPDPMKDFINPYSYVGNNPMNRIDPTGMVGLPRGPMLVGIAAFMGSEFRIPMWQQLANILGEMSQGLSPTQKYNLLRDIEESIDACRDMISVDGSGSNDAIWEGMARILESVRSDIGFDLFDSEAMREGWFIAGKVTSTKDPDTGEIISGRIGINLPVYNQQSKPVKISIWIHEAAHVYFNENSSIGKGPGPWDLENIADFHTYRSEIFAWERTFDYLSQPDVQSQLPSGSLISSRAWLYPQRPDYVINYTIYWFYDDLFKSFGWPYDDH